DADADTAGLRTQRGTPRASVPALAPVDAAAPGDATAAGPEQRRLRPAVLGLDSRRRPARAAAARARAVAAPGRHRLPDHRRAVRVQRRRPAVLPRPGRRGRPHRAVAGDEPGAVA